MQLSDFDYHLPPDLIARYPLPERSGSRLLCFNRDNSSITHCQFTQLPDLLQPGDLLVLNNTKVIPARIYGCKESGGKVEILIERILENNQALVLIKASKSPKPNSYIQVEPNYKIKVLEKKDNFFLIQFESDIPLLAILDEIGQMPLPPYFQRHAETLDDNRYQTVYAKNVGAVAAPTAGLHFDESLLTQLQEKGINFAYITLHVGLGTFQPVRVEEITQHKMHKEMIEVSSEVCEQIKVTKERGGRIIAVGTTTTRSLETASLSGELKPYQGETDIFIYPGFQFKCIDAMITNFHLPCSTLIMLVSAFAGQSAIMNAYQEAVMQKYRFFSYGDAMLIV